VLNTFAQYGADLVSRNQSNEYFFRSLAAAAPLSYLQLTAC
jgi:hypothetical protein